MKIILSQTPEFLPTVFKWTPPVGILYLAAVLEKMDVDVKIIDPIVEGKNTKDLIETIIKESPDVFGMYMTSDTYFTAARIIKAVKEKLPKIIIMAGGPHPTLLAGDMFDNLEELDIVVRGEGEHCVPLIIERLKKGDNLEGIPNTSFRQGGVVFHNPEVHVIENLDSIPFPALHKINYDKYNYTYYVPGKGELRAINITTSRGCPYNCSFCSNTNLWGRSVRMRSIKNTVEEIKSRVASHGIEFLWIQDDTFNLSVDRMMEFCDTIEKEKLNVYWSCILRADNINKETLARMKECGLAFAYFAVETINDQCRQKTIGKKLTRDMIKCTLTAFKDLNIQCGINFMVSLPGETKEMMEENIRYIENLKLKKNGSAVHYNITKIYPGTRLEAEAKRRGVLKEGFTWFDEKKIRDYSPGVLTGLYGQIPFYKENLSYIDIFSCLFRWKYSHTFPTGPINTDNLLSYGWKYLKAIKHRKDPMILILITIAWVKVVFMRLFQNIRMKVVELIKKRPVIFSSERNEKFKDL